MLPSMNTCTSAAPARFRELGDAVFADACAPAFWNAAARESSSLRSRGVRLHPDIESLAGGAINVHTGLWGTHECVGQSRHAERPS